MFREAIQNRVNWLIGASLFFVTIAVTPSTTLDPINVPKLWVLSSLAIATTSVLLTQPKAIFTRENWQQIAAARALFLFMLIAMVASSTNLTQQIFGAYGRNTGLLTYFCFGSLFIATAIATSNRSLKPILLGISSAVGLNGVYGLIQGLGADPLKWNNPYSPVIGTLGNPNFAGAFLGMGVALALSYVVASGIDLKYRVIALIFLPISAYGIFRSQAQQGIVVSILSVGLIGYFLIKSRFKNPIIKLGYLGIGLIATVIGILGTLQKGPLSALYKPSITYRGDYWHAGIEMFKGHPWFGVGLDSYGDYYRAARTVEATLRRGPATVSNAAHNVFIDIAATAGIFAILAYIAVIFLGFRAAWRISKRSSKFEPFFVSIFVMWIGYLVQSIISINNIALGIWGFVLPGILVAMDRWSKDPLPEKISKQKKKDVSDFSGMALVAGLVLGGVLGYLPFNSDANFRHSLESGDPNKIYKAATKWPTDTVRLLYAAQLFSQNKLEDKTVDLVREAVKLSPRSFDAWNYLYNLPSVSGNEKREILDRLKAIDPHNPDLKKLG